MFKLYKKQKEKVHLIMDAFQTRNLVLLTAEVGSGKTYMGTAVVKKRLELGDKVLVISPKEVVPKWNEVLSEAGVSAKIVTNFNSDLVDEYDFIVYDEIHTIKTKVKHFKTFAKNRKKILGLTGSIVDKGVEDITHIVNAFSNDGENYPKFAMLKYIVGGNAYHYVRHFVEPYLCVSLTREEVEGNLVDEDKIIVNTKNIPIDMSKEENAYYHFATYRMNKLGISEPQQMKYLNDFLDRVPMKHKYVLKKGKYYYVGDVLHEQSTKKDNKLKDLLENGFNENTLIYTLNDDVAKRIAEKFSDVEYVNTRGKNPVEKINQLVQTKAVVFDIRPILTGVDLHADNIIWYQTPQSNVQDIQGVGRIKRLSSSKNDKTVIYLYHKNTKQQKLVEKLIENYKLNNEVIGKTKMESPIPFGNNEVENFDYYFSY